MSLDVYLKTPGTTHVEEAKIYTRKDGQVVALTREEWDAAFPGREPVTVTPQESEYVFEWNITHNLGETAGKAGLYECLWRPDEHGYEHAKDIIELLEKGLADLVSRPDYFKQFNPKNGWGNYEGLVEFVTRYLAECKLHPDAEIEVSR